MAKCGSYDGEANVLCDVELNEKGRHNGPHSGSSSGFGSGTMAVWHDNHNRLDLVSKCCANHFEGKNTGTLLF